MHASFPVDSIPARILIVDDHPNTAAMLARVLAKFETPVEVLTAHSGEEALDIANEKPVDILITDFIMAGINGLDLVEKLRGECEPVHKILITAYDTPGLAVTARSLKVQDYLVKPVEPERLREIVDKALKEIRPAPATGSLRASQRQFKVLIADDYADNIRLLAARLKSEGYSYLAANDGVETLEKVRADLPDLVLLDVNMPRKDGFEVLAEIRADPEISHIPVIVITAARLTANDIREGLTLGADDYVTKPIDWRELSARIRNKLRVKEAEDKLRRRNRELEVFPEISQDLGERPDVEALTRTILGRTMGALEASNGCLVVYHPDHTITHQMHRLEKPEGLSWEEVQKEVLSAGLVRKVVATCQGKFIEDCQVEDGWPGNLCAGTRSVIAVPMLGRNQVLAVLVLTHEQPAHFKVEHLQLLQAIASQAAIAIENALLYAGERKRVNELVALNQLTREISQYKRSAEVFESLPGAIRQILGFPCAALWLVEGTKLTLKGLASAESAFKQPFLELGPQQAVVTRQPVQHSGPIAESAGGNGHRVTSVQSVVAVPMFLDGQVGGVLSIHSKRAGAFEESDRVLLETLAAHIANALERIRLFESIEKEQRRLSAVLGGAAEAILVMDCEGRLELANPAGKRLFTDVETRVGQQLPRQRGYDDLIALLEQTRQTGAPSRGEVVWPDERTFSVLVSPIAEGGQVALLHDVSHLKALDELKNEFIATASHDLKNPIFAILGYSDLMSKAGALNEMQVDFAQRIRNAAVQMQDLVLNLLDMARLDMGVKLESAAIDLNELLVEVGGEFQTRLQEKQHRLEYELSEAPATVLGDRMRLQQVARNLVGNAIKYTPAGGQIRVITAVAEGKVRVSVQDTGIGIPEDALPNLFTKFYRVRTAETEDIEGNGLGLAIVKSIVEKHGGNVSVESKLGEGSCFSLSLPQAQVAAPA